MMNNDHSRFNNLRFEDFRKLAQDPTLSKYEKIGFPDAYRAGKEADILFDIKQKLPNLNQKQKTVLDIGPGCSNLAYMLIELCQINGHQLILIDSEEMLNQLPEPPFVTKIPAYYPEIPGFFEKYAQSVDIILTYSVLQYVYVEGNIFDFLDKSLSLLSDGGEMLIGDIPNNSKRKRFFNSKKGVLYHQQFTNSKELPQVDFNILESGKIDDAIIISFILHCRNSGFDAYLVPQAEILPMANRREDILIRKP